jgi:quinol-cytochrome oxidoreductase complex cytochrome b subunit
MALSFPAAMGVKANPMVTPDHIKPEWFFFAMFRWLKLTSFQVGVIGTMVFMTVLLLWPFVDRGLEKKFPAKNVSFYIGAGFFVVYVFFTLWEAMV